MRNQFSLPIISISYLTAILQLCIQIFADAHYFF